MTEHEFRALFDRLRRSTPWAPSDRRGALNYITAPLVVPALGEVKLGQSMSLAAPIEDEPAADNPDPSQHKMTQVGDEAPAAGLSFAMDRIGMNVHGNADTHMDALRHVIYDGNLYNRTPAETVTDQGAGELSISVAADGVVGRRVLDIPRARGSAVAGAWRPGQRR